MRDFHELLQLKGIAVSQLVDSGFSMKFNEETFFLKFAESCADLASARDSAESHVMWVLEGDGHQPPAGCTVFNLLDKTVAGATNIFTDSAREFLRKRGIRFQPGPWRYRRGLI